MGGKIAVDPDSNKEDILPLGELTTPTHTGASVLDRDKVEHFRSTFQAIEQQINSVMINRERETRLGLLTLFAGGHLMIEGEKGCGKTKFAKTFAEAIGLSHRRIQMTPDKLPSEFAGGLERRISADGSSKMEFIEGPLFANVVHIDELSRTSGRIQNGLLEALEEGHVTVDNHTYNLPDPNFIIATLNPSDGAGTYEVIDPLTDRFATGLSFGHARHADLIAIGRSTTGNISKKITPIVSDPEQIVAMRELVRTVSVPLFVEEAAADLIVLLRPPSAKGEFDDRTDRFTDSEEQRSAMQIAEKIESGPSARVYEDMLLMAKARALMDGRASVESSDLLDIAGSVVSHRVVASYGAKAENETAENIVESALQIVAKRMEASQREKQIDS